MVTVPNLSKQAVMESLADSLAYIENQRHKEREYLLDFYEGINTDNYVKQFFGSESLQQVPIFTQNLTRRVCKVRSLVYKRPPKMRVEDKYIDLIDLEDLNASRRQLEATTFLMGCMAFRSRWNEMRQKIEYDLLPFFEPLFLPGEAEPFGVMYAVENHGMSKLEKPYYAVWTEERPNAPGRHFLINQDGDKVSVNSGDSNPYGIIPVTFTHRYKPIRDWWVEGASDVVRADLSTSVAMTELSLAIRLGAIGVKFVTGVDQSSRIKIGVDKILYLPEGSNFGITAPQGSLSQIIEATRFLVEGTLNNNHIRAKFARHDSGNAPSAEALKIQEMENYDERNADLESTWRPFEKRRYDIDRKILEVRKGVKLPEDYSVDFLEPQYPMSTMEEMQYWTWKFENQLANKMDWFDFHNPDAPRDVREQFKAESQEPEETEPSRLLSRLQQGS